MSDAVQPSQLSLGNAGNNHDFVKEVVNAIPGLFYLLDASGQFVMWNEYLRDSVVFKSEKEMTAISALDSIYPDDRLLVKEKIRNIISNGVDDWVEVRAFRRGGPEFLWYLLSGQRVIIDHKPFVIGIGTDITERKRLEAELQRLNRTLLALGKCNESILHARNEVELLHAVCHIIVEIGGYRMAWVGYKKQNKAKSVRPLAHAGFDEGYLEKVVVSWADVNLGRGPMGTAIRTGIPSLVNDVLTNPQFEPWRKDAIQRGYASILGLPLKVGKKVFGAITIYSAYPDAFDAMESELLTKLSENLAYGITVLREREARRLAEESLHQSEKRYRNLFQNNRTVMLITDPDDGQIVDANPAAATFYGWPIETLCRMHIQDINTLPPEQVMAAMQQTRSEEKNYFSFRHRRADGSIRDVEVLISMVEIGGMDFLHSIIHDVTERKCYETVTAFHLSLIKMAATKSIEELLQMTVDEAERLTESLIGFFHIISEDQTTISTQVCSTNTMKSMRMSTINYPHYDLDKAGVWADAIREKRAVIHNDYSSFRNRKGIPAVHTQMRCEVVVPVVRDEHVVAILGVGNKPGEYDEDDVKWVGIMADLSWDIVAKKIAEDEQKILQAQKYVIENLAMHDDLTGLPNRRFISDRISQVLGLYQQNKMMAALMIFDLDKFKIVNDTFGHAIGDGLLQQVTTRTLGTLRRSGDSVARLGGDEFVVLLPQIAEITNAVAIAEKIRSALMKTFDVEGHAINISCSIGIAIYPIHGQNELTLMKHADDAMYKSKSDGKNRITVFGDDPVVTEGNRS